MRRERMGSGKRKEYSYRVRWRYGGTREGAWQSVTVRSAEDAKSLQRAVEVRGHRVKDDDPDVLDRSMITGERTRHGVPAFAEVAEQYIASRTTTTSGTRDRYRRLARTTLADWQNRPVDEVSRDDVAAMVNGLTSRGMSAEAPYDFAKAVFRYATSAEPPLRAGNPCASVKCPRRRKRDGVRALEPAEASVLLSACDRSISLLVETVLATGLRQGEVFGLQVRDLRLGPRPMISVVRAVRRPEGENGATLGEPKSQSSVRDIVIDHDLAAALKAHVKGKAAEDFVFPNPSTGDFWRASVFAKRHWYPALERARAEGLAGRLRFHDLRHTHGSWLLAGGMELLAVSRRLGHDSVGITADIYGHVLAQTDDRMRELLSTRPRATRPARKAHRSA
ncbi:site-specific integrase [Phycicoccus sp. M110.8]|uniref:tyrosine-type recombinase/integrase n=1 Tax=Phycicoccus sp. M110.8 TaxID=3075433 RepID=UPI0028FD5781|nr:site-specific integrase [Phycicoccus sp. M110.8]MDU0315271.1 site-specific integrase [Phycicoccus sp. M110.8]